MFTPVKGRSVIVTGASRGIGKGIARAFVRAGADVLIAARDDGALRAAAEELAVGAEGRVETTVADVSRVEDCRRLAQTAVERFGRIDVLCANAGIFPDKPLVELTEADVDAVLGCNLKGTIFSVQACLDSLEASGHGRVVVTSSITGPITGYPGLVALRRQQGRSARLPAHRGDRARTSADHHQCDHAGEHRDRGAQ